ncbi:MAG: S41 family peptidase [Bacteroidales bacterium]|nr:S41 family peptidase [Bacteroidales bacterium]
MNWNKFLFLPLRLTIAVAMAAGLAACHDIEEWDNDRQGNFQALWTVLDQHYCFFAEKGVDWDEVYSRYAPRISEQMTSEELFSVLAEMLDELRDGHVNLSAPFNTSYYRAWWSDFPQNYDERLVQQYYFNFNYRSIGGIDYGILPQNVGYMRYPSFSYGIGEGNLDNILAHFATCDALIIDIRDNGGGDLTNVETLVARFITERTLVGYISHKTGPGHDDFSEPMAFYYNPASDGHWLWAKPVAVLTNRSTFSAANNFASIMRLLPNCYLVGATTGGGSGMPYSSEIPCGWTVRCSACPVLDAQGNATENGVSPAEDCLVDLDPVAALTGTDTMLDRAVALLTSL